MQIKSECTKIAKDLNPVCDADMIPLVNCHVYTNKYAQIKAFMWQGVKVAHNGHLLLVTLYMM